MHKNQDVNHQKRQIKVLGKRNKERIIPLTMELINSIDKYLILRNQQKIIDISYLLITDSGKKINSSMVYRKVNKLLNGVTTLNKKALMFLDILLLRTCLIMVLI